MEADTRRLQPASIGMFSIETGKERYTLDGHLTAPPFSPWRNNVTALSQRYNLHFVATRDSIAVFVPTFPYQKLGSTPSLIITPTLANKDARAYINQALPHAIDHLLVGDLGNEEILLVARDSGNVDAYHTRAIRDAIQNEPHPFTKDRHFDYVGLRAFFSQWVFESAWGLAIHKEARMIAVSANTPYHVESDDPSATITVFAFALSQLQSAEDVKPNDMDSDVAECDWYDWEPHTTEQLAQLVPTRDRNYKIVLGHGHTNNIPSISFANTSEDPEGQWLFSTDIEGDMIAWNIWQNEVVNSWTLHHNAFGEPPFAAPRGGRGDSTLVDGVARRVDGQTDRGWLVAALDPMAFAVAENMTEFCGAPASTRYDRQASFTVTDIVGSHVPGNSQRDPRYRPEESESESESVDQRSDNEEDTSSRSEASPVEHETNESPVVRSEQRAETVTSDDIPRLGSELYTGGAEAMEDEYASGSNDQEHELDYSSQHTGSSTSLSSLNAPQSGHTEVAQGRLILPADEGQQDLREHGGDIMIANGPIGAESFPTFPLLHCSISHMRLFDAPLASKAHWFCADLLTQLVPNHFAQTEQYALDRLNMIQQVPELGLVIVASQSGRCAVCSCVRQTRDGPLGLRVDWVLPTTKQEKAGLRPPHALLGIAVGPIQGMMRENANRGRPEDGSFLDRIVDGTPTSFDTDVVLMDSSDDESRGSNDEREAKRLKSFTKAPPSSAAHPKFEKRPWSQADSVESWRGVNYSRRYRLMLTYYDWTVLTYEIAREAPHLGIDPSRKNYRNRSAASTGYHNAHSQSKK